MSYLLTYDKTTSHVLTEGGAETGFTWQARDRRVVLYHGCVNANSG